MNARFGPSALTLIALFALGACAHVNERDDRTGLGDPAAGLQLAESHCSSCHAIGVNGESRHPMAPPFRTLSRDYPVNALEEALAEGILVGHPDMPEFHLEPQQIDDLTSYLRSIQTRQSG